MIKKGRVFILGAGFSARAKIPMTTSLLGKAMRKFSQECPGIYQRVNNYAMECAGNIHDKVDYSKNNFFSELCTFLEFIELREWGGGERWSDNGSREKLALRFYLAKTIAQHTPSLDNIPELYIKFVEQLNERDIVISFNWDCLLEVAILKIGKNYSYNLHDKGCIKLAKLHGSVNWRLGEPRNLRGAINTLEWRPLGFAGGMLQTDIYHTPILIDYRPWKHYDPLGELEPFLVLPGYGKAFDVRSNATLWYKPEFAFDRDGDVFIIGLGLSHDDFFIRSYFLSNLPFLADQKVYIINPAPDSKQNYDFILNKGNAELWNAHFSVNHVRAIKALNEKKG